MNFLKQGLLCLGVSLLTCGLSIAQIDKPVLEVDFIKLRTTYSQYIDVLANDLSSGSVLTIEEIALVNNGSASISNNKILFKPAPNYTGRAFVKYIACDEAGNCSSQDVHIYIPHASELIAHDTIKQFSLKGSPAYFFLPISFLNISELPKNGTVDFKSAFAIEYIPEPDFVGLDTILCSWGTMMSRLYIVEVVPNPPKNNFAKSGIVHVATNVDLEVNIDIVGDFFESPGNYTFTDFSDVKNHTFGQSAEGLLLGQESGQVIYYPPSNFEGVQSFEYTACNLDTCETGTVFLQVGSFKPRNDIPYRFRMAKGKTLVISYDIPVDPADFTLDRTSFPDHGDIVVYQEANIPTLNCGADIVGNNIVVYEPLPTYVGEDQFTLAYCLGNNPCAEIQVIVEVVDDEAPCNFVGDPVWPGDIDANGRVDMQDILTLGWTLGEVGVPRKDPDMEWLGKSSDSWELFFNGVDLKHNDANGDGIITQQDLEQIKLHYGLANKLVPEILPIPKDIPLFIEPIQAVLDSGDLAILDITLGIPEKPALDIHGFSFAMDIQSGALDSGSVFVNFDDYSWLVQNAPHLQLVQQPAHNRIEAAITRANKQELSGHGLISKVGFVIREDIEGFRSADRIPIHVRMHDIRIDGIGGQRYQLPDVFTTIYLKLKPEESTLSGTDLIVYPNPSSGRITIHLNGRSNEMLEGKLFNMQGQILRTFTNLNPKHQDFELFNFESGLYVLQVKTNKGIINKKIEILK